MRGTLTLAMAFGLGALLPVEGGAASGQDPKKHVVNETLRRQLEDPDYVVRYRALGRIDSEKRHPEEVAPLVIRCFKDPHHEVRAGAANTFGNLQSAWPDLGTRFPESIPQLIQMLSDRDPEDRYQKVRRFAAYALGHLGKPSKAAVPELLKIAANRKDDVSVRSQAVQALGRIGYASPEVVNTLIDLLDAPDRYSESYPTIGRTATRSLERLGADAKAAQPVLIEKLNQSDPKHRIAAVRALGTVGLDSLEAENALLDLLGDENADVQKAALRSLEGVNTTYALFFRNRVHSRETDEKQQAFLDEIRRDPERRARFIRLLAAQVRLGHWASSAVRSLVDLDARDCLPLLQERFDSMERQEPTRYFGYAGLRLQLLEAIAKFIPEKDRIQFLIDVESDEAESLWVRFRATILLCASGDKRAVQHVLAGYEKAKQKYGRTRRMTIETQREYQSSKHRKEEVWDGDADMIADYTERGLLLDPTNDDTDGDGIMDGNDRNPLCPSRQSSTETEGIAQFLLYLHTKYRRPPRGPFSFKVWIVGTTDNYDGKGTPSIFHGVEFTGVEDVVLHMSGEQIKKYRSLHGYGTPIINMHEVKGAGNSEKELRFSEYVAPLGATGWNIRVRRVDGVWLPVEWTATWVR